VGDPGDHPADLGAVGKGVGLADAAEAERPQRAPLLGLGADGRRVWVTTSSPSGHLVGLRAPGPARSRGRPAADRRDELLGVETTQAGDLVGTLERLEAGDGGPGHVDVVGRAERLAQHVVDAGLFEDGAGGATGDDTGTGAAGLSSTRPAPRRPMTGWVMVVPARGTVKRFLRASSVPFWMARGTSLALP
jgi:hypothetical protein